MTRPTSSTATPSATTTATTTVTTTVSTTPGAARPSHPAASVGRRRAWLLVPAGASLLAGLDAALLLVGVPAPVASQRLEDVHGGLMVLGFLATLIALERAVALGAAPAYAAPGLLGAGGLALLAPTVPLVVGRGLLVAGALALTAVYAALWQRQRDDAVLVEGLAAAVAAGAAVLWLRVDTPAVLPWFTGFVVLTVAAERVELARLSMPRRADGILVGHAIALLAALVAALLAPGPGDRAVGVATISLVVWLARHDVARRTVRSRGLPRFSAVAVLAGYAWLAVAGAVWVVGGTPDSTPAYDAVVHAVFMGFALSMVAAHAPVILPAVLRRPLPYHPVLWAPLALLHAGLVVRVVVGDALGVEAVWRVGSVTTVAAVVLLALTAVVLVARATRHSAAAPTLTPTGGRP
jgi:hypothetical protein